MSYKNTQSILAVLNSELRARYEEGDPIRLDVEGKPKFHILSFTPLAYEKYGVFRNRAPQVAGSLALRAFLSVPHPEGGAVLIAGVEAAREGYGFIMDGDDQSARQTITNIAQDLGHPGFRLLP